jgi:hypothetical protein
MDVHELKRLLSAVKAGEQMVPAGEAPRLARICLANIGAPDPELRDELIHGVLSGWIVREMYFSNEELLELLHTSLGERHLLFRLGEAGTDSVLVRSFSALIISSLIQRHRKQAWLDGSLVERIRDTVTSYLEREQDQRGFISGKGWAHSVAHAGDVLAELAQCPETGAAALKSLLNCIRESAGSTLTVFTCDEDERLAVAVRRIFERPEIADASLSEWLQGFATSVRECAGFGPQAGYRRFVNLKHFLRTLYFTLQRDLRVREPEVFLQEIRAVLQLCSVLQRAR